MLNEKHHLTYGENIPLVSQGIFDQKISQPEKNEHLFFHEIYVVVHTSRDMSTIHRFVDKFGGSVRGVHESVNVTHIPTPVTSMEKFLGQKMFSLLSFKKTLIHKYPYPFEIPLSVHPLEKTQNIIYYHPPRGSLKDHDTFYPPCTFYSFHFKP